MDAKIETTLFVVITNTGGVPEIELITNSSNLANQKQKELVKETGYSDDPEAEDCIQILEYEAMVRVKQDFSDIELEID